MKKIIISIFLCVALLLSVAPFIVFAEESEYTFEYLERDVSTGDGYIIVEYDDVRVELSENADTTKIPDGVNVTITIRADIGSSITALAYDNAPMSFGDPAMELNMTIDNYSGDHSLKVTYSVTSFTCSVSSAGKGKVSITNPATEEASVVLPMGEDFEFYAEAEEGCEILGIRINGEDVDLTRYGQTDVIKITRFNMELPQICEDTEVFVTFSGKKADNFKFGDVNKDAQVNVKDATLIQKQVADMVEFDSAQAICGDVDADSKITVKDATAIQKLVAGIIQKFPAEN
ncbi:MAG: dockerin type I repeat-containing protein [Ruminococcus sp.]|nr:dockerin type I repeat-containing protein [Ruminococcus sp.]